MPPGRIASAYCQYTAGLMGLCNHIGCMLFQRMTHANCLSILAKWNIPKLKIRAKDVKVKKSIFTKAYYKKKATHDKEKSSGTKKVSLVFSAVSISQNEYAKDGKKIRKYIFNSLGHSIKSSCFYELQTCSRPNKVQQKKFVLPESIPEVAMSLPPEGTEVANITNFINAMKIKKEEINSTALATKHQSKAPEWFKYKVGRITQVILKEFTLVIRHF